MRRKGKEGKRKEKKGNRKIVVGRTGWKALQEFLTDQKKDFFLLFCYQLLPLHGGFEG